MQRSPRVTITLSAKLMAVLEQWAAAEQEKPASWASFLLSVRLRDAIASGEIPVETEEANSPAEIAVILQKLIDRQELSADEEIALGKLADRAPHDVHAVVEQLREGTNEALCC